MRGDMDSHAEVHPPAFSSGVLIACSCLFIIDALECIRLLIDASALSRRRKVAHTGADISLSIPTSASHFDAKDEALGTTSCSPPTGYRDGVSATPDSGIGDWSPYSSAVGADEALELELVFRDCRSDDGFVVKQSLADAIVRHELSFQKEQFLIEIFERLDENQDGRVGLEQLVTASFHELEILSRRDHKKEGSPGAMLARQRVSDGTPLFSYLLSSKNGLLKIEALRELWESQLSVDDPDVDPTVVRLFLDSLSEQTGGTVNANELAKNMEMLLLESTDNSAATQTFRMLAVNAYKCEIEFLLTQTQTLREERNKLRRDLSKWSDHREVLIQESEDHKDMLHSQHEAALASQRKTFEDQLKTTQDDFRHQQDIIVGQYNEQVKSLTTLVDHLRQNETQLKEEIIDLKQETNTLEGELLDARAELNASNKMLDRLKSEIFLASDCILLEGSGLNDSSGSNVGANLNALREMNSQLKDKVDELTAETEQLRQDLRAERRKSRRKTSSNLGDDVSNNHVSESHGRPRSQPGLVRRKTVNSPVPNVAELTCRSTPVTPTRRVLPADKRPVVIGAENDDCLAPTNLMIETMVIPDADISTHGNDDLHEVKRLQLENVKLTEELNTANSVIDLITVKETALQSQITDLTENLEQSHRRIEENKLRYQTEAEALVCEVTNAMESKLSALIKRVEQITHNQEMIRGRIEAKEREIAAEYQTQMNELQECLIALTEDHTVAMDELKLKCHQQELQLEQEKGKYENALKKMETLHENLVRSKETAYTQLQDKHKKMTREKDGEIRKLRQALGDNWIKHAKDLEQKHKKETSELKKTILQLVGKQGETEEEMQFHCDSMAEEHKQEKEKLQAKINRLMEENANLKVTVKGARAEMDEECRHMTAGLHNSIMELKEERAFLEGENQARAEVEEQYRQMTAENKEIISRLEEEKQIVTNRIAELESNHKQIIAEFECRLAKTMENYKSLESQNFKLVEAEKASKLNRIKLEEAVARLQKAKTSAEELIQSKATEAQNAYEQDAARWELDIQFAKAEARRYKAMYEEKIDDLEQQTEQLKSELRMLQDDKATLEDEKEANLRQMEETHSYSQVLLATIDELQQQTDKTSEEFQAKTHEIKKHQQMEGKLEAVIAELKYNNSELQERADWLDQVNSELKRQNEELLKELDVRAIGMTNVTVQSVKQSDSQDSTRRFNLRSVQMKNTARPQPVVTTPPKCSMPFPNPIRIPSEEARKLTITVTDTTAQSEASQTQTIYYGGASTERDSRARRSRSPELQVEQLEKKLHEVEQENNHLIHGMTQDKAQLLKRIERVRQALSQVANDLEDSPDNSQPSRAQLEHAITGLRNKIQQQEATTSNQANQLKRVTEENACMKEEKRKTDVGIAELQQQLDRLTKERDSLRTKLEVTRKRTRTSYTQTHKATATIIVSKTGAQPSRVC